MAEPAGSDLATVALEVFEALPDGVVVLDRHWDVCYANPAAAIVMGASTDELMGSNSTSLFPEAAGTVFGDAHRRVMHSRVAETVDAHYPPLDRWFRNRIVPCGEGIALFFSEVTEEHQQRRQLLGELEVLQQVVDHAESGIVLKDLDGRYLLANRAAAEPTGLSPGEMVNRTAADLYPPEIADALRRYELEAQGTGRALEREERVAFFPGDERTYLTVTFPAYDAAGELVAAGAILTDVSQWKQAEADLEVSERRFRSVFAATSLGQIVMRDDGEILEVNEAICRMLGYSREDLVGASAWRFVRDIPWERRQARFFARGDSGYEEEDELLRRDGSWLPILATITRLNDPRADAPLVSCIIRDQSQVRALQERLLAAERMEAVGRLASGIAHDVNNVLAAVSGYAQLLSPEVEGSHRGGRHLAGIFRSVERAGDLVAQLGALGRRQPLEPVEQDLCSLVLDLDDMLRRLLPDDVSLVIRREVEAPVRADASQLQQVLLNLVLNARDALPGGGTIRVHVDVVELAEGDPEVGDLPAGRYARLVVEDDGIGMSPEVAHRCFEPFFTTRSDSGGNGLGLSTAYGIGRQSGGDLRVVSAPGEGSRFTLLLPALSADLPPRAPAREGQPLPVERDPDASASGAAPGEQPTGRQVLIADDDPAVLEIVTEVLSELGHDVLAAADGESALALAERAAHRPALLVTDIEMPGLDGRGLTTRLRERWPELPVLVVSGLRPAPPGVAFLRKPFTTDELAAAVQAALGAAVTP